jgi:hypothetical protein
MSNEQSSKIRRKVTKEDRVRLRRLNEEVRGRTEEIARIMSRYLGTQSQPVRKVTFTLGEDNASDVHIEMEPVIVVGDGKGCYDDPPGVCCECPC